MDKDGKVVHTQDYGMDQASTGVSSKNLASVEEPFQNLSPHAIKRPTRETDVVLGFEYVGFYPVREQSCDHLLVIGNKSGKCKGENHSLNHSHRTLFNMLPDKVR